MTAPAHGVRVAHIRGTGAKGGHDGRSYPRGITMNARSTRKLALTVAIGALVPIGLAMPAQAATVVSHDGCTIEVDPPVFNQDFDASGAKLFDYVYHLTCAASPGGVSVEVKAERHESDLVGRTGDPDAPDEFTGRTRKNHSFGPAGGTKNITVQAVLPLTNDDTDSRLEMFQVDTFRVTSGPVTGSWSAQAIGFSRALTP